MAIVVKTEPKRLDDVLKAALWNMTDYNIREGVLTNDTGAVATFEVGTVLTAAFTPIGGVATDATGILAERVVSLGIAAAQSVAIITKGPCQVHEAELSHADSSDIPGQILALEALDIQMVAAPTESTQAVN